jgi:hypothetical protein
VHVVAPSNEYEPALQVLQVTLPSEEYFPAEHEMQELPNRYFPAGQMILEQGFPGIDVWPVGQG